MKNTKQDIGKRIKALREGLGMTQAELAKSVGYSSSSSRSTINKIELGINDIAQSKLPKYAQALNTTVEYLIGIDKHDQSINFGTMNGVIGNVKDGKIIIGTDNNLSAQEQDLFRIFRSADGKQQLKIMQLAYSIEDENKF